jgi:hypothetical protein
MTSIVATGSITGFFDEVVEDAIRARGVEATEEATRYLVGLLTDYAKPDGLAGATLERPLAFLLDEAMHTLDLGERFERLRTLGDGVLYSSGFFGDHFERRGVDQRYLVGIGVTAYRNAGSLIRAGSEEPKLDVFAELSEKFVSFVEVITEVADATVAMGVASSQSVMKLYERWLKTRSDRLAHALSSHGFVAPRGKAVLQ